MGRFEKDKIQNDEERVEICDIEGRRLSMRHLVTLNVGGKTYMLLADDEVGRPGMSALMLVREERTADGAQEYVISVDDQEIERVMERVAEGMFAMRMEAVDQDFSDFSDFPPEADEAFPDEDGVCLSAHSPLEFCYCGDPNYLQ